MMWTALLWGPCQDKSYLHMFQRGPIGQTKTLWRWVLATPLAFWTLLPFWFLLLTTTTWRWRSRPPRSCLMAMSILRSGGWAVFPSV